MKKFSYEKWFLIPLFMTAILAPIGSELLAIHLTLFIISLILLGILRTLMEML